MSDEEVLRLASAALAARRAARSAKVRCSTLGEELDRETKAQFAFEAQANEAENALLKLIYAEAQQ